MYVVCLEWSHRTNRHKERNGQIPLKEYYYCFFLSITLKSASWLYLLRSNILSWFRLELLIRKDLLSLGESFCGGIWYNEKREKGENQILHYKKNCTITHPTAVRYQALAFVVHWKFAYFALYTTRYRSWIWCTCGTKILYTSTWFPRIHNSLKISEIKLCGFPNCIKDYPAKQSSTASLQ